jgi:hypothetical protein
MPLVGVENSAVNEEGGVYCYRHLEEVRKIAITIVWILVFYNASL